MDVQDIIKQYFIEIPPNPSYEISTKLMDHNGLFAVLEPQTAYEADLITRSEFVEGLMWGLPRYGHPEGRVAFHIREVFQNIDYLQDLSPKQKEMLRIVALVHDTFKFKEDRNIPRDWSKHHGVLARKYIENDALSHVTNVLIELHDEAFYAWRAEVVEKRAEEAERRLLKIEEHLPESKQAYFQFFLCDTLTGDKLRTPIKWLYEKAIERYWF